MSSGVVRGEGAGASGAGDIVRGEADITEGRDVVIVRLPAGMGGELLELARKRGVPRNTLLVAAATRALRDASRRR